MNGCRFQSAFSANEMDSDNRKPGASIPRGVEKKPLLVRGLFLVRNLRSRKLYTVMRRYCRGRLLDVGGWDFFLSVRNQEIPFAQWITVDNDDSHLLRANFLRYSCLQGDGYRLPFRDGSFETVLGIQILEHVLDPMKIVVEIERVLKPEGHAIFLIPQTANIHMIPQVYYNFTRFWIASALARAELQRMLYDLDGGASRGGKR